jgi:hypothetical protein
MDIDCMTVNEQTHLMKEGKCFRCKLFGHLSQDCPNKQQTNTMLMTLTLKWTDKSTASHIRALIAHRAMKRRRFWKKKARRMVWVFKVEDCLDVSTSSIYFLCAWV